MRMLATSPSVSTAPLLWANGSSGTARVTSAMDRVARGRGDGDARRTERRAGLRPLCVTADLTMSGDITGGV